MTKMNGILTILAITLTASACGYQGYDADEEGAGDDGTISGDDGKSSSGGSTGVIDTSDSDGGTDSTHAGGGGGTGVIDTGTDAGSAGSTDAGTGGSPPVSTDAGTAGSDSGSAGSGGGSDAGAGGSDAGPVATQPDPVIVTGACQMKFSTAYVANSATAELRGNLPGVTWSSGPAIADNNADKYLEYVPPVIGAGTYEFTYMVPPSTWANLGDATALKAMTSAAREFVSCNWWDPVALKTVSVGSPSCNLRIAVGSGCAITPAGNMKDFK